MRQAQNQTQVYMKLLEKLGKETYLFGDASCVAQALEAVRDGVNIALKL